MIAEKSESTECRIFSHSLINLKKKLAAVIGFTVDYVAGNDDKVGLYLSVTSFIRS